MQRKELSQTSYLLSPESSRPKVQYIPSFRDILVRNEVVTLERFTHSGGIPAYPSPLMYADEVETTQRPLTGEIVSRIVTLAPKFIVDEGLEKLMPFRELQKYYRELAGMYEWMADDKGIYVSVKTADERAGGVPQFYVIADNDPHGKPYSDEYPPLGEILHLEEYAEIPTSRHVRGQKSSVFEKLAHIERLPGPLVLPFYVGLLYDPKVLDHPYLSQQILSAHYDPDVMRETVVAPYIYASYYSPLD